MHFIIYIYVCVCVFKLCFVNLYNKLLLYITMVKEPYIIFISFMGSDFKNLSNPNLDKSSV